MMNSTFSAFSAFSSPLGACHLAPPATSSSLVRAIPFLRISRKFKASTFTNNSFSTLSKKHTKSSSSSSPATSSCAEKSAAFARSSFADVAPPAYSETVEGQKDLEDIFDLYFESNEEEVEKRMQAWDAERRSEDGERVAKEDGEMSRALMSMGL